MVVILVSCRIGINCDNTWHGILLVFKQDLSKFKSRLQVSKMAILSVFPGNINKYYLWMGDGSKFTIFYIMETRL